jgi:peroxiredoxin Q/BCP
MRRTPGCTREALRFNELYDEFEKLNVLIVGISTDDLNRVKRFKEKYGLRFKLLSDPEAKVVKLYGVLRKRRRKKPSAKRVTFIIGPDLVIKDVLRNIRPAERHADEALKRIKDLLFSG